MATSSTKHLRTGPATALVMAGGGAAGAYEAGVLLYLLDELPRRAPVAGIGFQIFAGTSVGALHSCFLASMADDPAAGANALVAYWRGLTMQSIMRFGTAQLLGISNLVFGARISPRALVPNLLRRKGGPPRHQPVAGIFDTSPLHRSMEVSIPWSRLHANVASGRVRGVALCATEVCSGQPTVFYERAPDVPYETDRPSSTRAREVRLSVEHAMASAAMPFLFPSVQVDGVCYVDGGLRQNTPISPVMRFGADRMLVISPQTEPEAAAHRARLGCRLNPYPGAFFLLGRLLTALLNEALENELRQVELVNRIIGCAASAAPDTPGCGPRSAGGYRHVNTLLLHPSVPLEDVARQALKDAPGELTMPGPAGRAFSRVLGSQSFQDSDLLSFVMFTPTFVAELIQLGYSDAKRQKERLLDFFAS